VALEVLALKKVFFKKYKKFELEPKIDKVGWWLAIKVLIFSGIMAGIAATTVVVSYILSTCESVPALLGSLDEITRSAAVAGDADPQLLGAMLGESLDSLGVNLSSVFLVVIPASLLVALFISFLVLRHYIRKNATYKCQHASEIVH
jgi:hypothetical protein